MHLGLHLEMEDINYTGESLHAICWKSRGKFSSHNHIANIKGLIVL